jgi:hypothetical protein
MLRSAVQEVDVPLNSMVIVYVAKLPAVTGVGELGVTLTLFGFPSLKVPVSNTPDVSPVAI